MRETWLKSPDKNMKESGYFACSGRFAWWFSIGLSHEKSKNKEQGQELNLERRGTVQATIYLNAGMQFEQKQNKSPV